MPVGAFALRVNGAGFVPGTVVWFDGLALPTTFVASSVVTATGNATAARSSVPVVVRTPDGSVSNSCAVSVVAVPQVSVAVSPASVSLQVKRRTRFTAEVDGMANTAVIWKVNGIVGGNTSVGTIT